MKNTTVAWLLKAVLVICAGAVILCAAALLPAYMKHVVAVKPEAQGCYGWILAYGWLLSLPALVSLGLLWGVFGTIGRGEAFCEKNAVRFQRIWQLALFDLALVCAMGIFLAINRATPPFLVVTLLGLLFLGVASGVTCFALSGLVRNAARLREENDMTI